MQGVMIYQCVLVILLASWTNGANTFWKTSETLDFVSAKTACINTGGKLAEPRPGQDFTDFISYKTSGTIVTVTRQVATRLLVTATTG